MDKSWMIELASHYEKMREKYPHDKLLLLFDIDGTILDMRYMVWYLLKTYDLEHETDFFQNLSVTDITVSESQVEPLLDDLEINGEHKEEILAWYEERAWSPTAILHAHRPFSGVLEVIRWFQMQPDTYVGLNTARSNVIRSNTLRGLNKLGEEYKVYIPDELLFMMPEDWPEERHTEAKVEGLRYFVDHGYRPIAFIDNEPSNLESVANSEFSEDMLFLHADTIFQSKRTNLPPHAVGGNVYDLTELIPEEKLPKHTQFVWRGINDKRNLTQFLESKVRWGEFDVRIDPSGSVLILRADSFVNIPQKADETWLTLDSVMEQLSHRNRALKLNLKAGGAMIDRVLQLVEEYGFRGPKLWFDGNIERLHERGFRQLATARPNAVIQCPIDFLAPLVISAPSKAKEILDMLQNWGINRFAIDWQAQNQRQLFDQLDQWGFETNIYNVSGLESFLQATLLGPKAITSDFNFPQWDYHGRGLQSDDVQEEEALTQMVGAMS